MGTETKDEKPEMKAEQTQSRKRETKVVKEDGQENDLKVGFAESQREWGSVDVHTLVRWALEHPQLFAAAETQHAFTRKRDGRDEFVAQSLDVLEDIASDDRLIGFRC